LLFSITSKINVAVYRIKAPYYYFESIYVSSENKLFLRFGIVFLVIFLNINRTFIVYKKLPIKLGW
jgi:hypothetical protein